jgi:hypothetical protein
LRFIGSAVLLATLATIGVSAKQIAVKLGSRSETVVRGHIPVDAAPVLRVKPGQVVTIDALSHQGLNGAEGPVAFFGRDGIKPADALQDAVDVAENVKAPSGAGVTS